MLVHFICRGNAQRSLMAEAYLKSLKLKDVDVMSSGTVAEMHRALNEPTVHKTRSLLKKYGLDGYSKTSSDQLTQERLREGDITICMNQVVFDEAKKIVNLPANTFVWDITDTREVRPLLNTEEQRETYAEKIFQEIKQKVDELRREIERH